MVVIVTLGQFGLTENARVPAHPRESAIRMIKFVVVDEVGVPLITPLLLRVRPTGKVPELMLKV